MRTVAALALCALLPIPILAQSFATAPVRAGMITAPAKRDTVLPSPLVRTAVAA